MAIPDLDDAGFLPPGIHQCTIDEIKNRFGRFQVTNRRCRLSERLESFLSDVRSTGIVVAIIIDGSFVTGKDSPNDIDLILVLASDHDFSAPLRPIEYNVVSRRQVQRRFGLDILVAQDGAMELIEYIEFFAGIRGTPERQKGLLRVTP